MNNYTQNQPLPQRDILRMVHFVLQPSYNKISNKIFEYLSYSQNKSYPKRYRNQLIAQIIHLDSYSDSIKQDTRPQYLIKYPQLMAPKIQRAERILNQLLQSTD